MNKKVAIGIVVAILIAVGIYFFINLNSKQLDGDVINLTTNNWKSYSSTELRIDFKYPENYNILDLLNDSEKAILLGDKEFPNPDISPGYHAPITISRYESARVNDQTSSLANVKRGTIIIDGQPADVIEGNYPDYPAPGALAGNHMKIVTIPSKNLSIRVQDSYAGTKSDWGMLSSVLRDLLSTIEFQ